MFRSHAFCRATVSRQLITIPLSVGEGVIASHPSIDTVCTRLVYLPSFLHAPSSLISCNEIIKVCGYCAANHVDGVLDMSLHIRYVWMLSSGAHEILHVAFPRTQQAHLSRGAAYASHFNRQHIRTTDLQIMEKNTVVSRMWIHSCHVGGDVFEHTELVVSFQV